MSAHAVLLLGLGLGLRHALDADHLVVVATLLQREPGVLRAARVAALWGAGHTVALGTIGLLVVLAGVHVPAGAERVAEALVGLMLIAIGLWHGLRPTGPAPRGRAVYARPLAAGVVHGLGGSAGVALLALTTIGSRGAAVAWLALFAVGTVVGMVGLTLLVARPLAWTVGREGGARRVLATGSAAIAVVLGGGMAIAALVGEAAG